MQFELTLQESAHKLREFAELTARASGNWGAYEEVAKSILDGVLAEGKRQGKDE